MKHFMWFVIFTICTNICIAKDSQFFSEKQKETLRDQISVAQGAIKNFYVKYAMITSSNEMSDKLHQENEWAFSGEKLYYKHSFDTKISEPFDKRYGLQIWDGKFLKSYDSLMNNGSVRNNYKRNDPNLPFSLEGLYAWHFGTWHNGSLPEFLTNVASQTWDASYGESGKDILIKYHETGKLISWTLDINKNYMITSSTTMISDLDNKPILKHTMTVSDFKEVANGVWLPIKSKMRGEFYRTGKIIDNDIIVSDIKVNDSKLEDIFVFNFPPGSQFYDYILDTTIMPGMTEKTQIEAIAEMAEDIKENKTGMSKAEPNSHVSKPRPAVSAQEQEKLPPVAEQLQNINIHERMPLWKILGFSFVVLGAVIFITAIIKTKKK